MNQPMHEFRDKNGRIIQPGHYIRNINSGTIHKAISDGGNRLLMLERKNKREIQVPLDEFGNNILAPQERIYVLVAFEIVSKTVTLTPELEETEKELREMEKQKRAGEDYKVRQGHINRKKEPRTERKHYEAR